MVENNILQSVELNYHELLQPFLTIINLHMCFHKKFHRVWFTSKNHSLQEKIVVS